MSIRRYSFYFLPILLAAILIGLPTKSQYFRPQIQNLNQTPGLIVGRNVNMVSGTDCINGDPYLQRQNEPSMAVSTRNPLHLIAGANDYRTVDMPQSEGPLPGIPEGAAAGDAWLGLFKSFNGGESWISTLLPGHPKDITVAGRTSPLYGLSAASDPTVRAGTNGLFYYSGIAFDRVVHGRSVIFVARFIDNNVTKLGDVDPIKYLNATIIDQGTSGQFADKPWIAVDAPRNGSGTVPIYAPDTPVQNVARHNVYIAYSIFLGSLQGGDQSKIMFARSNDCGTTWQSPIKVSESQHINQGTTIAVSPKDGTIYIAWRRFASQTETSAIMMSQSKDFGYSFTKAVVVANINAFDQYSAPNRFRTYAFPTLAVDENGIVYVAWSERAGPGGDARIVISTSTDGMNWIAPFPIDNHGGRGHQIMPSLTYMAGRLMMTWYDTRQSEGGYGSDISDPGPSGKPHTIDVWIAQALPSLNPTFTDSTKVSKYLHWMESHTADNATIVQKEANHPNYNLFTGGNNAFFGDYIDIASAPMFLFDDQEGRWRFNTKNTDPATSFISWTDNRDVNPGDGIWTNYTPPSTPCSTSTTPSCQAGTTGKRNQNIYTSHITQGIMIGAPVNTKPLITYKRTFLVFVRNLTEGAKQIRLMIETPNGMQASFWESWPPTEEGWKCPFLYCGDRQVDVDIAPYSSITLAVFVKPYVNPYATFRVNVEEIDDPGNFVDYIVLNPDPVNTQIVPVLEEYHTPTMMLESPAPVNFSDPTVLSENIVYIPNLEYILANVNPDIVTPTFRSPTFRSGNIVNPTFRSSAVGEIPDGKVTDLQWRIKNNNDATSAYSFVPIGDAPTLPTGGAYQLLIYRVSTTPASGALPNKCELFEEEHHELLLKVESPTFRSPTFRSPTFRSPTFRSPTFRSNTFSLAPGEEAVCTLRFIEPTSAGSGTVQSSKTLRTTVTSNGFNPNEYAKTVGAAAVSQAFNPDGQIPFASSMYIIEKELPAASVNYPYGPAFLEAYGGKPTSIYDNGTPNNSNDDIWKYDGLWKANPLFYPTGQPSGLSLDINGNISGTPIYYPDLFNTLVKTQILSFVAEVTDISNPPQIAQRELSITVNCVFHPIKATAGVNGEIRYKEAGVEKFITNGWVNVLVPHGGNQAFTINPSPCYDIANVTVVEGGATKPLGKVGQYTFETVRSDGNEIEASFTKISYVLTTTVEPTEGGSITPSNPTVGCGDPITFTISANEGYLLVDVTDNGASQGAVTTYTINPVTSVHTIIAKFKQLEIWVQRYNNDSMNGDDEAKAIAVNSSGNVYVTGYSTGRTTGPDAYTISYNSEGIQSWSARYDGPAHLGDYANAVAVDNGGNAYVTGYGYRGMVVKHSDYSTQKYDNSGKLVWDAQYDDRRNGNDEVTAMAVGKDGFVYITGRSEDSLTKTDVKHYDYYTIKYNPSTGKVEWFARYDNNIKGLDEATAIAVDSEGNVYVTGRSQGSGTDYDYATIKYDKNGVQQWVSRYNYNNGVDGAAAIAVDSAGNVYVTGRSQGSGTDYDYATIKYDKNGVQQWVSRYNYNNGVDEATAIALDSAGNVYVTGRSQGNGTGFDYVTIKYGTSLGQELWASRYDNKINGADEATAIALDTQGNVYVTGRSQGSTTGLDYLTIKYDSAGKLVWRVRYNNSDKNGADEAAAIALDSAGNVYVTGRSQGGTTGLDYATVKYKQ
jgi:hypothetical protein